MARNTSTSLWRPGNALAALGILFLRLTALLPLPMMRGAGKALGSVAAVIYPYRRHVGLTNLRLCFPDMSETERKRLLYKHYQAMGMGLFELGAAWWKPWGAMRKVTRITGLEHLEEVRASGRGALMVTAHFTTLEIAARCLLEEYKFCCLYRKPNQPYIAKVMTQVRETRVEKVIHFDEMQTLIRALRGGSFVWYAPDQGKKLKYSAVLPFFGEPAVTNTATGRIARMGKAAIVPYFGYRDADGTYRLEIYPEVKDLPTDNPEADAVAINRILEDFIRRAPEQYFWLHRRFKRRGPDFPDAYARSGSSK
jgi:KDO2-lipid IV(A) lauroyltransferase